jgi:hypothetical protein
LKLIRNLDGCNQIILILVAPGFSTCLQRPQS